MAVTPDNYLNIIGILINEIIGSVILAIFIGSIAIVYLCIKNDVPLKVTLGLIAFFSLLVLVVYYDSFILALIALVLGSVIVAGYQYYLQKQNH